MMISSSSRWSRHRRTLSTVLLPSLLLLLSQYPSTAETLSTVTGTYVPLSYPLKPNEGECLYERIVQPNEDLTASVFVNAGDDMRAIIIFEGPVAPIDLDFFDNTNSHNSINKGSGGHGAIMAGYITRYKAEGSKMFVNGKFGDSMMNVQPLSHHTLVDFEYIEEQEDTYEPTSPPAPAEHRHQVEEHHRKMVEELRQRWMRKKEEAQKQGFDVMEDDAALLHHERHEHAGDDVVYTEHDIDREETLLEQIDHEGEVDDDFVKMQIQNMNPRPTLSTTTIPPPPKDEEEDGGDGRHHHRHESRRLSEAITRPPPGEPYQYTTKIVSPGWYRLCIYPATTAIDVEMELRKSSTYGKVDDHTGHVPNLEDVEVHSEIHALYSEGEIPPMRPVEGREGIADDDLRTTRDQLRILERVYGEIITRQLEERRKWNWRYMKNQHIYSHLVLGNLIETVVYMIVTGWQVYTIRKWFSNTGPKLGR
jgi:hypothetical protein